MRHVVPVVFLAQPPYLVCPAGCGVQAQNRALRAQSGELAALYQELEQPLEDAAGLEEAPLDEGAPLDGAPLNGAQIDDAPSGGVL